MSRTSMRPNGGCLRADGYVVVTKDYRGQMEHVLVAERALGKPLPPEARVHHVDEDRSNNAPHNLVVCPSEAYHQLLHQRMRAYAASGHYDWRICSYCQRYDAPANLFLHPTQVQAYHRACRNAHDRARRNQA